MGPKLPAGTCNRSGSMWAQQKQQLAAGAPQEEGQVAPRPRAHQRHPSPSAMQSGPIKSMAWLAWPLWAPLGGALPRPMAAMSAPLPPWAKAPAKFA